jgi:ubiquinone/menaquinone biosynthesis C-methylase UbiE
MDHDDHLALIRDGVRGLEHGRWADLGSGTGAFTLALAQLLGSDGRILSVDRDRAALAEQERRLASAFPDVSVERRTADLVDLPALGPLDGVVMANSLHFIRERGPLLRWLRRQLVPGGRLLLVEYDADDGNRWVPHPLSFATWQRVAVGAGFGPPRLLGRVPSRFLGAIWSAVSERPG